MLIERDQLSIVETILIGQILIIFTDNKKFTCKNFNTNRVLRWGHIPEEYDPYKYIKGEKNMATNAPSIFPLNRNQQTTQNSTYQKEIVSCINDIKEISESSFPMN